MKMATHSLKIKILQNVLMPIFFMLFFTHILKAGTEQKTFNVTDFGAVADGKTVNTKAINDAIVACNAAGGGVVNVPSGIFITGGIKLMSNVNLNLEHNAVIRASTNVADFKENKAMIGARDVENVAITGTGSIDMMSVSFVDTTKIKTIENPPDYDKKYTRQGERYMDPAFGLEHGPWPRKHWLGCSIDIINVRHATLRDVTIINTCDWSVRVMTSKFVDIHGLKMYNHLMTPNSDGIHISSSCNVIVSDCIIEGGDDALVVTAFIDSTMNTENITVTNCTLMSRSSGIRVGWCNNNLIRNCVFSNLVIYGSNRGIGVFTRKNGSIENILFNNITIEAKMHKGHWWGHGEAIHVSNVADPGSNAYLRNVRFSNIIARADNGILITGLGTSLVENVTLDNIDLTVTNSALNEFYGGNFDLRPTPLAKDGIFKHDIPAIYCGFAKDVKLRDITVHWEDSLPDFYTNGIEADNTTGLVIDGFCGRQAHVNSSSSAIYLHDSSSPTIRNCIAGQGSSTFLSMVNVKDERLFVNNDLSQAKKPFMPSSGKFLLNGNLLHK